MFQCSKNYGNDIRRPRGGGMPRIGYRFFALLRMTVCGGLGKDSSLCSERRFVEVRKRFYAPLRMTVCRGLDKDSSLRSE